MHDYGGGVLATAVEQDRLVLAWIDSGCLWRQDWALPQTNTDHPTPLTAAQQLSREGNWELADGVLDLSAGSAGSGSVKSMAVTSW